jgi:hypothetical protein
MTWLLCAAGSGDLQTASMKRQPLPLATQIGLRAFNVFHHRAPLKKKEAAN